ncbi:uncharacterized protein LOC121287857 [Carcharodon carcharias]|uniref:uncharacterized protein LOC121287857 n=1 Tax=Carcharodon carcharias TaxID=13397 RepID=UPI001B7E4DD9|nr:uncharacterized protein LOC121287857 [Carcharodon carcharias]XP_041061777.1 uncharacterized protein LOC121287857 [Carcharodon carcharias]
MSSISAIGCLFLLGFGLSLAGADGQPKHLECYNDYLKEIICTWNVHPNTNCSADYRLQYELVNLSLNNETRDIKTLPGSICQSSVMAPTLVFHATYKIKVIFKGIVALSKNITSSQTIKPLAPYNLKINTSGNNEQLLVWDDDYKDAFIKNNLKYQVTYMTPGGNWKMINTTNQKMLVLRSVLEPGYTYHLKVRSKPLPNYDGVWSDWSIECVWPYDSSDLISSALIVLCIIIPLLVALCFFGFKFAKKSWWENIPSPQKSALSKESFDKFQKFGRVFSENTLDNCKVEKISCTNELPCFREKNRIESPVDQLCTVNINFPAVQPLMDVSRSDEKFPFPHFSGFSFPVLTESLSPFPLPFEDLSLSVSDGPGYTLFNSVSKDQWAVHEDDKYHPFTRNEDKDFPLTLNTYSLCPDTDSKTTGSSEQIGYKAFNSCLAAPWAKAARSGWNSGEQQSSEVIQTHLVSGDIKSTEYMSSDKLTFKSSNEVAPNCELDEVHNTLCNFTLGAGTHFPMDPFPMFCESLQSLAFHSNGQEEPGWWQPCPIHSVPGAAVSLAGSDLDSRLVPPQDCCLRLEPTLGTLSQGHVGQVEPGTEGNTVKKDQMKYIVVPEDAELGLSELTPYMKLSLLNVQATDKSQGAEPIHPPAKQVHLKC